MARFFAERIEYDLTRLNEVPSYYRERTRVYIIEHQGE